MENCSPVMMHTSPEYSQFFEDQGGLPAGFPFDNDMSRGHQGIRSHLEDLAQRHPEFAEHLRCPPWGGDVENRGTWGSKRKDSGSEDYPDDSSGAATSNIPRSSSGSQENQTSDSDKESRGQRSSSAPPDGRATEPEQPQRFVSRININPVNPSDPASMSNSPDAYGKPPVAPKQPQSPQQSNSRPTPPKQQAGNVRHIPIFVEGRDEPILPRGVNAESYRSASPPTFSQPQQVPPSYAQPPPSYTQSQQSRAPPTFARPSQFTSTHQFSPQRQQSPSRSIPIPVKIEKSTSPKPPQAQPQPQQKRPEPQQQQGTPPPQPKPQPTDPLSKVNVVRADVEGLGTKVEQYSGTSRKDKDYIYLDEMLTRNLLKLDDIDTEGKDNVRQARKDVICMINKYIGILESKVPLPEEPMEAEECQPSSDAAAETSTQVEEKGDNAIVEENQTMEVETEQSNTEPPVQTVPEEPQQTSEDLQQAATPAEVDTKMELDQSQQPSGSETSQTENVNQQQETVLIAPPEVPVNVDETVKQDKMEAEPKVKSEETKESTDIKAEDPQSNSQVQDKMEVETEEIKTEMAVPEKEASQPSETTPNTLNPENEAKSETSTKSPKSPKKSKGKKSPKKS